MHDSLFPPQAASPPPRRQRTLAILGAIALFLLATRPGLAQEAPQPIGYLKEVQPAAFILRQGERVPAQPGGPVFRDDSLETGPDGALGVVFNDSTRISIGPDTTFVVDSFAFQPEENQLSFLSRLERGTLQFISGAIAKLSPKSVAVKTPLGTIGTRGTHFLVKVGGK